MKKFLLGMFIAFKLVKIGRWISKIAIAAGVPELLADAIKDVVYDSKPVNQPYVSKQRTDAAEAKIRVNQAAVNRIIDLNERGRSIVEIAHLTELPQSSVLHVLNKVKESYS